MSTITNIDLLYTYARYTSPTNRATLLCEGCNRKLVANIGQSRIDLAATADDNGWRVVYSDMEDQSVVLCERCDDMNQAAMQSAIHAELDAAYAYAEMHKEYA